MKKLVAVLAAAIVLSALIWLAAARVLGTTPASTSSAVWAEGLGTTDEVMRRFPRINDNETARRVVDLAAPLGIGFHDRGNVATLQPLRAAMTESMKVAFAKSGDDLDPTPPAVTSWLAEHGAAIGALQRELIDADAPVWTTDTDVLADAPLPRMLALMDLFRIFAVDALEQHRRGNDAMAWDDLHASWKLSRGVFGRPELISQLIALSGARMANGVAAKLSAPEPEWRREVASFDVRRSFLASLAYEASRSWRYRTKYPTGEPDENRRHDAIRRVTAPLFAPFVASHANRALEEQRQLVADLAATRECAPPPLPRLREAPNLGGSWRRVGRFRAEIEGVEKLLALKAERARTGAWPESMPSVAASSCSDGGWQYRREADGSMTLAFSREIGVDRSQSVVVPLRYHYAGIGNAER